jgi:cell division protein FtsI (penicillin-binding protein 3)
LSETQNKKRLLIFLFILIIIVSIILTQYASLMLFTPSDQKEQIINEPLIERGPIYDRNGNILAITTSLDSVSAWLPDLENVEETVETLSEILNIDKQVLIEKLASTSNFVWIKRKITPTESDKIKILIAEKKLPGIELIPEYGRIYPNGKLACHVLGYVGVDNIGLDGIEYSLQEYLAPEGNIPSSKKIFGNHVFLTIDMAIQYSMEKIAEEALEDNQAESVMLLVLDAKSADILAYVSYPNFDPNYFLEYDSSSLINRPLRYAYEPGSVFKVFSLSSISQLTGIGNDTTFFCNGYYENKEYDFRINCMGSHGNVNIQGILMYSCNAGAAYASELVDQESLYKMLTLFGFGRPTGIMLSGESPGILRPPSLWSIRSKPTIVFGQEISVTALQIVSAATVLTNDGFLLKPNIIKAIISPENETIKEFNREPVIQVVSKDIAQNFLLMMENATAILARIEDYRISAKTGTAQVMDPETKTYSETVFVASILGIFPTDDPQVIVYVVITYPKGVYYGNKIAAPVFREAALALINLMNIPNKNSEIIEHSGEIHIESPEQLKIGSIMPNLTGMPKRLINTLFKSNEFSIIINGEGYVIKQSPPPGTQLESGMEIYLEFK